MQDGQGVYGQYGGMIYAITNSSVLMWIPEEITPTTAKEEGYIFNFGGKWGEKKFHQKTNEVIFRIELINWVNKGK